MKIVHEDFDHALVEVEDRFYASGAPDETKAPDTSTARNWNRDTHGHDAEFPLSIRNANHPEWEFPDGVYRLHVKAKDAEGHSHSDAWDIRVDNRAPRILKVKFEVNVPGLTGFRTVYEYDWIAYAQSEVAVLHHILRARRPSGITWTLCRTCASRRALCRLEAWSVGFGVRQGQEPCPQD